MREHSHSIVYQVIESEKELSTDDRELLRQAREAASRAYAPYSHFHVGAAVRLANQEIITGNNQENAAFPSGLCAERVAMFYASSLFPGVAFTSLAIYARAESFALEQVVTPCGSCRQVIAEYEHLADIPLRILMQSEKSTILLINGIENLLPFGFSARHLNAGD